MAAATVVVMALGRVFWICFAACLRGDRPLGWSATAAAAAALVSAAQSLRPRAFRSPDRPLQTASAAQEEKEEIERATQIDGNGKPRKAWRRQRCSWRHDRNRSPSLIHTTWVEISGNEEETEIGRLPE